MEDHHTHHRRITHARNALLGCTALASVLPVALRAQDAGTPDDYFQIGTIEIVAGGGQGAGEDQTHILSYDASAATGMSADILDVSAAVTVVTAEEIRRRNAQNTEQVLQYTPAVNADFYGSDDRFDFFNIRGFLAYTYRDGLRLGSSDRGGPREELYAFDRVEVIRGGNSTTFGISDPGGSVNFVSKTPRQGRYGEIYGRYSSYNTAELGFDFGDDLNEEGTVSYRLTGIGRRGDSEYDHSTNDMNFLMGGVTWRPTDATSVIFTLDHLNREGVPGSGGHPLGTDLDRNLFFGEPDFNYRGIERTTATIKLGHDFGAGLTAGTTLRYSDESSDFGYAYVSGTSGPTTVSRAYFANDRQADEFIVQADVQYDTSFGAVDSRTLAGVEYSKSNSENTLWFTGAPDIDWTDPVYSGGIDLASLPAYSDQRVKQSTAAVFAQQEFAFADRYILNLGLRHDWIDQTQADLLAGTTTTADISETTGRIGLTYKVTPGLSLYGAYSQSVVPPARGGLSLEPERGEQFELGVKYRPENTDALFSAAVYDLRKNNITRTNPVTLMPDTIGEVQVRGLDLEAKVELYRNFSLTAGYSYMDAEIQENGTAGNEGNTPAFIPQQTASLWANYFLDGAGGRGDMSFGLGARFTGSYAFDDANTLDSGDSLVFDASFTYDIVENAQLALNISNLLDEKHVAFGGFGANFYNPGREVSLTLRNTW